MQVGLARSPPVPRAPFPVLQGSSDSDTSQPLAANVQLDTRTDSKISTMQSIHTQLKSQHMVAWLKLLDAASGFSHLVKDTVESNHREEHRLRVIERFAPSTLAAYFRMWDQWISFCEVQAIPPFCPMPVQLADFLQVHSRKSSASAALGHYKALTWVSKYAVLPQLSQALQHALVRSYSLSTTPTLRREAAPLPLAFVLWLENEIVHERGSPLDCLLMGGVLVLVWSSLRWSDAQCIAPNDLVEDDDCIRGVATRTKSTKRGMPFGFLKAGLTGHSLSVTWSARWLNILRQALAATEGLHPGFRPDFLIPTCGGSRDCPIFTSPMPRSQGIITLRKLLLRWDGNADLTGVGVHSCKVTLLSWARQLNIDEELRMAQGHHRVSSSTTMAALYSRDDVHPALQAQRIILQKILQGFRPITPALRGGQVPLKEHPVTFPAGGHSQSKELAETGIALPSTDDLEDTDSDVSDPVFESDQLHPWSPGLPSFENMQDCIFLLNQATHIAHVAAKCDREDPAVLCASASVTDPCFYMFACGTRQAVGENQVIPSETIPADFRLCLRPACAKIFD